MEFPLKEDDVAGDNSAPNPNRASGSKRSFGDLGDGEGDTSGSKKDCKEVDEAALVAANAMILSLTESLQSCKDDLASTQTELVSAKAEIQKWESAFKNESFVPSRKTPEPSFVTDYIQKLKTSETSLKEQLEIAQMKLAIRDLKSHLESGSMKCTPGLLDRLAAANAEIKELKEVQFAKLTAIEKVQAEHAKTIEYSTKVFMYISQNYPEILPIPVPVQAPALEPALAPAPAPAPAPAAPTDDE